MKMNYPAPTRALIAGAIVMMSLLTTDAVVAQVQDSTASTRDTSVAQRSRSGPGHKDGPGRSFGRAGSMRRATLQTMDALPDGAQTLLLKGGKELYFSDGQLFTFAESRSLYVEIPERLFVRGMDNGVSARGASVRERRKHQQAHRIHNRRFHRDRSWT